MEELHCDPVPEHNELGFPDARHAAVSDVATSGTDLR
jgi:hypothetical protein